MYNIKKLLLLLLTLFTSTITAEESFLSEFIIGKYLLIGKSVDSEKTYTGKMEIYNKNNKLKIKRIIGKAVISGEAAIEKALNGEADVLRLRFSEGTEKFEETCLIRSDLNNYARITCYLYKPGEKTVNPGMEALFYDHTAK